MKRQIMGNKKNLLNVNDLDKFCKTFIGSGDTNAEIAFVGVEFSSEAKSEESISSFFNEIKKRNFPKVIGDYRNFVTSHTQKWLKGYDFDTSKIGAINSTRHKMSMMAYALLNKTKVHTNLNKDFEYKKFEKQFANAKSKTISLELYALPCENERSYKYNDWVDISKHAHFSSKSEYRDNYRNQRQKLLKKQLENPKLKYIVLYSLGHKEDYEKMLGIKFKKEIPFNKSSFYITKHNNKTYVLMNHFSSFGFSYNYLNEVIKKMR
jgi:hypothetical protein